MSDQPPVTERMQLLIDAWEMSLERARGILAENPASLLR